MIFIKTSKLKPGMVVGQTINYPSFPLPLIVEKTALTSENISRLKQLNIAGIYVLSKYSDDIVNDTFLSAEVKETMTNELKSMSKQFISSSSISPDFEDKLITMSETIMDNILKKDNYVVKMIQIKTFDDYIYSHSMNVGILCTLIGLKLGYSKLSLTELTSAGLMHDLGKLDIDSSIVNKTSKLNDEEYDIMKSHPIKAVEKLKFSMKISKTVLDGIASHHERFDGSGYPFGLIGKEIPLCARILTIADVYDALTTARSYRPAWSVEETIEYMKSLSGVHFDPEILESFIQVIAIYPIGTLVSLSDDSLALVIKHNNENTFHPIVRILKSQHLKIGTELDLSLEKNITISQSLNLEEDLPEDLFKI